MKLNVKTIKTVMKTVMKTVRIVAVFEGNGIYEINGKKVSKKRVIKILRKEYRRNVKID